MEERDLTMSGMTESNSEINKLLLQTDCLLSTTESQSEAIEAEDKTAWIGDDEPSLIFSDISDDLFKGVTFNLNFSSSFSQTLSNDSEPSDGKNFDEMLNDNDKMHDEDDKTQLPAYNSVFDISGCDFLDDTPIDNQNHDISNATLTSQDSDECNETVQSSIANDNDSNVTTNNSHVTEDFGQNATYEEPQAVDKPLETENSSYDITELTPSNASNRSEIIEIQSIPAIKLDKLSVKQINITKSDDSTTTQIDDNTLMQSLNVTDEIVENKKLPDTSQESNQIGKRELSKRKAFKRPSTNEKNCKKLKSHTNDSNEHDTKDNDSDTTDTEDSSDDTVEYEIKHKQIITRYGRVVKSPAKYWLGERK